jgi:dipeptidase D
VASINGGTKRNVIPSTAEAVIVIKQKEKGDILRKIRAFKEKIGHKLIKVDPDVEVTISGADAKECFDKETTSKITAFLHVVPHGVVTMSYEIEGLVQTSTNLAVVKTNGKVINVQFHSRSSSASGIETIKSRLCALGELMGIKVEEIGGYPGWQPNLDSKILSLMKSTHEEIFGKEARHAAVHAGLECGIIGEKFPGMDMVSFGPEIKGAHSIEERVQIKSVDNFWKVLVKTLENFAKS